MKKLTRKFREYLERPDIMMMIIGVMLGILLDIIFWGS